MRLDYRLLVDDGHRDVRVEVADGATVGDLARAVAAWSDQTPPTTMQLSLVADHDTDDPPAPDASALDAAPRSGATVRLVGVEDQATVPPRWSPVSLQRIRTARSSSEAPASGRLPYGSTVIGAALIHVGRAVTVHTTGDPDRVSVDGTPVIGGTAVDHGALVRIGTETFTIAIDGSLHPPVTGPLQTHASDPAIVEHHEPVELELPAPPAPDRLPGFPVLSAVVPLLMGAAMWVATRSVMVAGFALFSVAFVVASGIEVRREHRRDRRFRDDAFRSDLAEVTAKVLALRAEELQRTRRDLPSGAEVGTWPDAHAERIWERRGAHPAPLRVRIGTQVTEPVDPVRVPDGGRKDLRRLLEDAAAELRVIDRPVGVDLGVLGIGIAGGGDTPSSVARSLVTQLAATLDPDHLAFVLAVPAHRAGSWAWMQWLPHRVDTAGPGDRPIRPDHDGSPTVVTILDLTGEDDLPAGAVEGPTLVVADRSTRLPTGLDVVVAVDAGRATVRRDDGPAQRVEVDVLGVEACEHLARQLASLRPTGGAGRRLPTRLGLEEVVGDPALLRHSDRVRAAWDRSRSTGRALRAPIGRSADGVVHLDLQAQGPHGLVAGTTGSGKSELLRTLVTSLALHHPPDRLTFLLVDYKGGATFGAVAELPHVVGVVSDLGPSGAQRAITSLRAEIHRREHLVATAGAGRLDELGPDAPPALVVVVDEFATLARDLPDVLDGLLDVSQRGRSLGVHLLLSTQRPNGIVTDAVRANLALRLALRVADEDDSRDVVDDVDAARLPSSRPGRAVLRLGPGARVTLQVADTTAPLIDGPRVRCSALTEAPDDEAAGEGPSQLEAAVRAIRDAAVGLDPPRRPWVEPLPARVVAADLPAPSTLGRLVIGLIDRPHEQRRVAAEVDLAGRGGVAVLGPPRSGRTATLGVLAAASVGDADQRTVVYGIDGGRDLTALVGTNGPGGRVADVVAVEDDERVLRLLRCLHRRCRTGAAPLDAVDREEPARVLLLVDGIGAFVLRHEDCNRGEAVDLLTSIAVDGASVGVHVAVAAGRAAEIPAPLAHLLDHRIVLRPTWDDGERPHVDSPPATSSATGSEMPPGRGLLDGEVLQVAAPDHRRPSAAAARSSGPDRDAVARLPATVAVRTLPVPVDWRIPVGIGAESLDVVSVDLRHHHGLVLGPPRGGRSTALAVVVEQVRRWDPSTEVLHARAEDPDHAGEVLSTAAGSAGGPGRRLVVVDDLCELLDGPDGPAIDEAVLTSIRRSTADQRLVVSGEADAVGRCYGESVRRLRSGRTGILLRPDPDLHSGLLHTALPRHDELRPSAGRGWIVTPDTVVAAQLAS